jgi:hypothetical protein
MTTANQCDGCRLGAPLRDGMHLGMDGRAFMTCQAARYAPGADGRVECRCGATVAAWALAERGGVCPGCGNPLEPAP